MIPVNFQSDTSALCLQACLLQNSSVVIILCVISLFDQHSHMMYQFSNNTVMKYCYEIVEPKQLSTPFK